ncbi:unnamed protein product [Strongylus vulgaris]|uniref:Uncharacterized protein n=1 Tax=Strongylus vulgaris TaxID=40348 RepID=A0A3P7IYG3_STRVU|nr:unnamed protein product [Strongylus vulgaris]
MSVAKGVVMTDVRKDPDARIAVKKKSVRNVTVTRIEKKIETGIEIARTVIGIEWKSSKK